MDVPKFDPSQADYPLRINPSMLDQLGRIAQYLQPFIPPHASSQRTDNCNSIDLQVDSQRQNDSYKNSLQRMVKSSCQRRQRGLKLGLEGGQSPVSGWRTQTVPYSREREGSL
ncbi:hypothetical protein ACTXT7_012421 [Hymenolepis weldensis]